METLDWTNPLSVDVAKTFFDIYVTTWNPRDIHRRNIMVPRSPSDDPFLLTTTHFFSSNPSKDYEHLFNRVQGHTKCNVHSCLRKRGYVLTCHYKDPWKVCNESLLSIDEKGQKKYELAHNDDRVNVHNADLLKMWHASVDCHPVVYRHAILTYIAKYASKVEKRLETYQDILTKISNASASEDIVLCVYKIFLAEKIVDLVIGAQETFHMFLKLPLVVCS